AQRSDRPGRRPERGPRHAEDVDAVPGAPPHHRRRALRAHHQREPVVLDHRLPALHAARDHARRGARSGPPRAAGCARQLQDRRPQVQHGKRRLQTVPQLPAQAPLPAVVQGIPMTRTLPILAAALAFSIGAAASTVEAQAPQATKAVAASTAAVVTAVPVAPDYVIGPDDVLSILFWRDKDLSAADVTVRPDGKITLPLMNDVQASGRTPEELG